MEWFARLDAHALLAFNLILGVAMSVILVVTRLGLGTASGRVDIWLTGALLLLSARLVVPLDHVLTQIGLAVDTSTLVVPLVLAGLYWQAEGMRALHQRSVSTKRIIWISVALAVTSAFIQVCFDERALPVMLAAVNVLLVKNAVQLGRRFWGGRLLAVAAAVLLTFNGILIAAADQSSEQIGRLGLLLEMVWVLFSTAGFLQCLYQDIRDRLAATAITDALTGALNRTGVTPLLRRDIEQAKRAGDLSVVLCDLDHFKAINDTHGHPIGDKVLQRFVSLAKKCMRSVDLVGRWGGEEFLLVLPTSTIEDAVAVTQRVQEAIAASEATPKFTFSAGIACASESRVHYDLEALLSVADQRLYVAKKTRNTTVWNDGEKADHSSKDESSVPARDEAVTS